MNRLSKPERDPGYVQYASPSTAISTNEDWARLTCSSMNRIVGWHTLKDLLQPKHSFFNAHLACLDGFSAYQVEPDEPCLLYPRIKALRGQRLSRLNPYRQHQLARSHTARITSAIFQVAADYQLKSFAVACLVFTFPQELSHFLAAQPQGVQIAWRLWHKLWAWYDSQFSLSLAASVNLHTWKTESPNDPHFHFHAIIPNYGLTQANCTDENGLPALAFQRQSWYSQHGGTSVPLSDANLSRLKRYWYTLLRKLCVKHACLPESWREETILHPPVDIFVDFVTLSDPLGRARFMHKLNYQQRRPIEDWAKWSNDHLDAPPPSEAFCRYANRARVFGWWKNLKSILPRHPEKSPKLHPLTGQEMTYLGHETLFSLTQGRPLGFLDMVRGKPIMASLTPSELHWLRSVQLPLPL
jgi:hypothetical protein